MFLRLLHDSQAQFVSKLWRTFIHPLLSPAVLHAGFQNPGPSDVAKCLWFCCWWLGMQFLPLWPSATQGGWVGGRKSEITNVREEVVETWIFWSETSAVIPRVLSCLHLPSPGPTLVPATPFVTQDRLGSQLCNFVALMATYEIAADAEHHHLETVKLVLEQMPRWPV